MNFEDTYPIIVEQPVAWGDMDAFGHVNNTRYFRYFEDARIAYFEATHIAASASPSGVGPILATTNCRFRAPLTYPDTIRVGARVVEISDDRFTMEYGVWSTTLNRVAATGGAVVVSFDYDLGKKASIPDAWLSAIKAVEN